MLRIRGTVGQWPVDLTLELDEGDWAQLGAQLKGVAPEAPAAATENKPLNQDDRLWQVAQELLHKAEQMSGPDLLGQLEGLAGSTAAGKHLLVHVEEDLALPVLGEARLDDVDRGGQHHPEPQSDQEESGREGPGAGEAVDHRDEDDDAGDLEGQVLARTAAAGDAATASPTATAAASTTVPTTARMNRRMADQAPARPARRRIGTNKASDPSGAATRPASSSAWSMRPFTGRALRTAMSAAPDYPGKYGVVR